MSPFRLRAGFACALGVLAAATAGAESALRLPYPHQFSVVPAATYDTHGDRVGEAHLALERLPDGQVRLLTDTGFESGPRTVLSALLEPVDGRRSLRPVWQESHSFGPGGAPLGMLRVDHVRQEASCVSGPELDWSHAQRVALPDADRVANVTLSLLFLPLVDDSAEQVEFQIFLCGGGPRVLDFRAAVADRHDDPTDPGGRRELVEVSYAPDLGPVGLLVAPLLPRLSFWFDPAARQPWLAHRIPLYSDGPEVLIVRDGLEPARLVSGP